MRLILTLLLTCLNTTVLGAEKILVADFLRDIRDQFHRIQVRDDNHPEPAFIRNVHVEMHVIAEKDDNGKTAYYVLEGQVDSKDVITQKLSFDLELLPAQSMKNRDPRHRSYSTRPRDYSYGPDSYRQRQYPYYPDQYMPEVNPVILFNKGH